MRRSFAAVCLGLVLTLLLGPRPGPLLLADEVSEKPEAPVADSPEAVDGTQPLSAEQELLSRRYKRFVEKLRQIAEHIKKTDPNRAELLNRAIGKSNKDGISRRLDEVVQLLGGNSPKFGEAIDGQEEVVGSLNELLQLLLSEDEQAKNRAEQARIEAYLRKLNDIINKQKDTRAATERKENAEELARRQQKLQDQAKDLNKQIDGDDAAKRASEQDGDSPPANPMEGKGDPKEGQPEGSKDGQPNEGEPKERPDGGKPSDEKSEGDKPKEGDPKEGKPGEGTPEDGESKDAESKDGMPKDGMPAEGQPSEGQPMPGQPMPGEPMPGQPGESQPPDQSQTPGREELERARQEMEKAIQELKKKAHDPASDHQDQVLKELQKAKEKLEEILRQLRDEEKTRFLQALEARFQKMLTMQVLVYDGTLRLDRIAKDQRTQAFASRAHELSRTEEEIVVEATRALTLLREEGTAVAFPEAVEQMRDDMRMVARWLARSPDPDTGKLTQAVEKEVIDALEEMIEALQKEMEKMKEKEQQQQQDQQGQEGDPELVDLLGELKLLRSLQHRVNRRTRTLGQQVQGEQAQDPQLVEQLRSLAERQARIQKAASDLATGRNK